MDETSIGGNGGRNGDKMSTQGGNSNEPMSSFHDKLDTQVNNLKKELSRYTCLP